MEIWVYMLLFVAILIDWLDIYHFWLFNIWNYFLCLETLYCGESGQMPSFSEFKRHLVLDIWELVIVDIYA